MTKLWKDKRFRDYYSDVKTTDEFIRLLLGDLLLQSINNTKDGVFVFPPYTLGANDEEKMMNWINKCYRNANIILTSKDETEVTAKLRWLVKNRKYLL